MLNVIGFLKFRPDTMREEEDQDTRAGGYMSTLPAGSKDAWVVVDTLSCVVRFVFGWAVSATAWHE